MIGAGFGVCLKFMITNYIKDNNYDYIKRKIIPLFIYIFICSIFV